MKTFKTGAAGLLALALSMAACEKTDNDTQGPDMPGGNAQCLLEAPAIGIGPFGAGSPATRAAQAIKEERQAFNVGEELGNIITLGNSKAEETPQTRTLNTGAYCRIVIYKLEDWNTNTMKVLEQRLCKQGSTAYFADHGDVTTPIYLYPGSYKIFCYSFNKTANTKMGKIADGAVNVPLSDGDDFMSVVKDLSITSAQLGTSVSLGTVTLEHRCCQLIGVLTAEAFTSTGIGDSPAPSLSAVSTFTTAGNWSINGNSFAATATASQTKAFTMTKSGNDYKGTMIILPLSGKALNTNYTFKPNGSSTNITASNKQVNASTSFSSGGSYSFTVKAIGAYVPSTESPVLIGSYKWATANLDNTRKLESNTWTSGKLNGSDNDYWRWNVKDVDTSSAYPTQENTWNISNDPCRAGLGSPWRVPPKANFDNLVGYTLKNKRAFINGTAMTTNGYGWVDSGSVKGCVFVDTTRGTCIFLPAAGDRNGSSYYHTGTNGSYWSGTLLASGANNAYYLYFYSGSCRVYSYFRYGGFSLRCSQ